MADRQLLTEVFLERFKVKPWYAWICVGFSSFFLVLGLLNCQDALSSSRVMEGIAGGGFLIAAVAWLTMLGLYVRFYKFLRWADAQQSGTSTVMRDNAFRVTP